MDYKQLENEVGGSDTINPAEVAGKIKTLLKEYNSKSKITFDDILDFHVPQNSVAVLCSSTANGAVFFR